MSREVPYEVQTLAHPNPIARFAHRVRYRESLSLALKLAPEGGTVVDFGAGEGEFLHRLGAARSDVRLVAYEPFMTVKYSEVETVTAMTEVGSNSVDLYCAFETLEHLTDDQIEFFIDEGKRVCRPNGKIVVSAPVMQGVALPIKEAARSLLFRHFSDYSFGETMKGILGMQVPRAADIKASHKGFDQRRLYARLSAAFTPERRFYSPFSHLPWWCNSQAFFVFDARNNEMKRE